MKQAKFALTAVAILAVVGGALAFKAQRGNTLSGFIQETGKTQCTLPFVTEDRTLTPNAIPVTTLSFTTAKLTSTTCQPVIIYSKL